MDAFPARLNAVVRLAFVATAVPLFTACLSTGVRSSGSELPQAATAFGDGQLRVSVDHNCKERCETMSVDFENLTTSPMEILVNQARLQRGAEKFALKRQGEQTGNLKIPPKKKASADFAPYSAANGRRLSYVAPEAVWCSLKVSPECKNTAEADALCAGYARSYFDVYTEAGGWILLNFAYNMGGRTEMIQSPAPETLGRGPDVLPKQDDRAPAFFREPNNVVFYKMECNEKCRCTDLTKPRRFSDDKLKPVIEPIP
ncbi:MAG: hypothetical protein FJY29_11210 [Betaproteobacteria bacterium]|nr:hypothetical protein [Betaproteobacteria bacterium]